MKLFYDIEGMESGFYLSFRSACSFSWRLSASLLLNGAVAPDQSLASWELMFWAGLSSHSLMRNGELHEQVEGFVLPFGVCFPFGATGQLEQSC